MESSPLTFKFAIDRGGTFTDLFASCSNGQIFTMKLLSENPTKYPDAAAECIRRVLSQVLPKDLVTQNGKINGEYIEWIRMGTTVATNTLLERTGEQFALVVNQGLRDVLYIGNQARPDIFSLVCFHQLQVQSKNIEIPPNLYSEVVEVSCRIVPEKSERSSQKSFGSHKKLIGTNSENYIVLEDCDEKQIRDELTRIKNDCKIDSLVVILAHSYACPDHELQIAKIAKNLHFKHITLSHQVMPMIKMVPRGFTSCLDSYLTPKIHGYVRSFLDRFTINERKLMFMQSNGGLTSVNSFTGFKAIISGPAGGLVGYAKALYGKETNCPIIGFDMGGTSTDVSRYENQLEHVYETVIAGITVQCPQLDINTVAAGGGSILKFLSGIFQVGPESAGAYPGPACYRNGGPLTITDANLMLGRLRHEYFPKIFGKSEDQQLDRKVVFDKFQLMANKINEFLRTENLQEKTVEEIAAGFLKVANENVCRPIRNLTEAKGYDIKSHILACFGGAGGQHACSIAKILGIKCVLIHRYASILSAYGIALADYVYEIQDPCSLFYSDDNIKVIDGKLKVLTDKARRHILNKGFDESQLIFELYLNIRYEGTDFALMCMPKKSSTGEGSIYGDFVGQFYSRYYQEFGFNLASDKRLVVDDIRVRAIGKTGLDTVTTECNTIQEYSEVADPEKTVMVYFEDSFVETSLYNLGKLKCGDKVQGPAILIDTSNTILIEPDCTAHITNLGNIRIDVTIPNQMKNPKNDIIQLDSIRLSIYSHRFMGIAEQMGRILQRTAISTNIKERLDFSCALFGPDGGLVSNAPHIPVHLGAMQETVRYQINEMESNGGHFKPGDVLLSNHPCAGGSHLPDLTVITPVFYKHSEEPVLFVANRGHHSDIGGLTPGSMPPNSTTLKQEGAIFKSFYLVKNFEFNEFELIEKLMEPGNYKGCSGTRNLADNISDLKAQIAANKKGISLISELIDNEGLDVVQAYMRFIQDNAEIAIREMLVDKIQTIESKEDIGNSCYKLYSEDFMDDGSLIKLTVTINCKNGDAIFDFESPNYQVYNNWNAPKSITISAIIYCLRCMIGYNIPLNQGCLKPIKIRIPNNSMLNPDSEAAVVGGNVLTSQRIVDVIFKAFEVCAASQGCMNNVTFGCDQWGYYETISGGSGAGPNWHGRSGVHTHMTNTRITDIEIMEQRYPVVIEQFCLRQHSGGGGTYRGGDGVVRQIQFREKVTMSVLTERRTTQPYGMKGGEPGQRGLNLLIRKNGQIVNIGGKNFIEMEAEDKLRILTPGGGGFGTKHETSC